MIERAIQALAKIPADKVAHFAGGCILAAVGCKAGVVGAVLAPFVVGLAKEVWDHFNPPHVADPFDLIATALGSLPILLARAL